MGMDFRSIDPVEGPLRGRIRVPGSKSITNRAILLASLAEGRSRLSGSLESDDTDRMKQAVAMMGVVVAELDGDLVIDGVSGRYPRGGVLDAGLGGTPARFLLAAASLAGEDVIVDGAPRLRERPMDDGVAMLRSIGAHVEEQGEPGRLPLGMSPGLPSGSHVKVGSTASSQFISALMLIGPFLPEGLSIEFTDHVTSASYVRLTAAELVEWGVPVEIIESGGRLSSIEVPRTSVKGMDRTIPPDASSIIYWATAASIIPGSSLLLEGVSETDLQPDAAALKSLAEAGSRIEWIDEGARVEGMPEFQGWSRLDAEQMPDGAVALAAAAACGTSETRIDGLATLRIKESNRIEALGRELGKIGVRTSIEADSMRIWPMDASTAEEVKIDTYDDHRIAMAFAVLGLRRGGISIEDHGCVSKSYPSFWSDFDAVAAMSRTGDNAADS